MTRCPEGAAFCMCRVITPVPAPISKTAIPRPIGRVIASARADDEGMTEPIMPGFARKRRNIRIIDLIRYPSFMTKGDDQDSAGIGFPRKRKKSHAPFRSFVARQLILGRKRPGKEDPFPAKVLLVFVKGGDRPHQSRYCHSPKRCSVRCRTLPIAQSGDLQHG